MAYDEPGQGPRRRTPDRLDPRARKYALMRLRQVAGLGLAGAGQEISQAAKAGIGSSDPTLRWRQVSAALAQRNPTLLDQPGAQDDAVARMLAQMGELQGGDVAVPELAQQRAVQMAPLIAAARQFTSPPGPGPLQALQGLAGKLRKRTAPPRIPRRGVRMAE